MSSAHVRLPGYFPLHRFVDRMWLEEIHRICWLATDPGSPLLDEIQNQIPNDHENERSLRIEAIKEIGVIAEESWKKSNCKKTKIPSVFPLQNFISKVCLEELSRLTKLATDRSSPLYTELQAMLPNKAAGEKERRVEALLAVGKLARDAASRCV